MSDVKGRGQRAKTGSDRDIEVWLKEPDFAREYEVARAEIAAVDKATNAFLQALDKARIRLGLTKAELARRIGAEPVVMRRLVSAEGRSPTLATLLKAAAVLWLELELRAAAPVRT
jgi:hypothetical protein